MKTLKKSFFMAMTISVAMVCRLFAQQEVTPSSIVMKTFTKNFENAVNLKWQHKGPLYVATFLNNQENFIAFIDGGGNLYAHGRKMPDAYLPIQVKSRVQQVREKLEKKYGLLLLHRTYEIVNQNSMTEYYLRFQNNTHILMIVSDVWGNTSVKKEGLLKDNAKYYEHKNIVALLE